MLQDLVAALAMLLLLEADLNYGSLSRPAPLVTCHCDRAAEKNPLGLVLSSLALAGGDTSA